MLLLACGSTLAPPAAAQTFPSKPMRFVVPYAPGGNTDMIARVVGVRLADSLGHAVVVENRPGAATLIGSEFVARSAPDGYTILLATSTTLAINPHLYRTLPYHPVRDFAPVALIARTPMTLVVHPSLPVKSIKDLVALARMRPGQLAYGSAGTGSPSFMSMEMLKSAAKLDLIEVPYKGSGPADIDLLGGQIAMMFQNTSLQYVKAGRLRALAHTGEKRTMVAPEVPTLVELGYRDLVFYSWQGVVAPARTPPEVIARLNAEVNRVIRLPDVQTRITADGAEMLGGTAAEFGDYIKLEIARFAQVIRDAGVKPE
ncbi:MAG: tripartite tricarboxylate transporter substrate binding protein [Proteobacteria bacterium]|nr:tripartite tricarboxylate transporter substrate binding protein [Burkholderiales bacterium]